MIRRWLGQWELPLSSISGPTQGWFRSPERRGKILFPISPCSLGFLEFCPHLPALVSHDCTHTCYTQPRQPQQTWQIHQRAADAALARVVWMSPLWWKGVSRKGPADPTLLFYKVKSHRVSVTGPLLPYITVSLQLS